MSAKVQDDRKQLFESAISFLGDPSVKDAPLTKKIEFLQSKGLTEQEVALALKESQHGRDKSSKTPETSSGVREISKDPIFYETIPPPLPRRDWKDYFIMATATAGLCYGVYEVTKRYVIPNLLPESQSKLDQDKKEVQEQFDKVDKLLETIEREQSDFRTKEEQKLLELDKTVVDLHNCLEQTTHTREKIEDEFKMMKLEMANLQNKIDNFILSKKNDQQLDKISTEFESLKHLIKNRESSTTGGFENSDRKSPHAKSPVPGVDAIPSAAEILSKMNFNNNKISNSNGTDNISNDSASTSIKDQEQPVPAWKKAREESLGSAASTNSIPEWQKSAMNEPTLQDWQNKPANTAQLSQD